MNYRWPGNVRELENEIKRVVGSVPRATITEEDLSESIWSAAPSSPISQSEEPSLKGTIVQLEKRVILEALQSCKQNRQQAARLLGLSRQGLFKKMKRYGIKSSL